MQSFDFVFAVSLNKMLNKQLSRHRFEMPQRDYDKMTTYLIISGEQYSKWITSFIDYWFPYHPSIGYDRNG